jgi:small subunit ribosomal protein S17
MSDSSPTTGTTTDATASAAPAGEPRSSRKVREGLVTSTKMDKTIVVQVVDRVRHPRYRKTLQRTTNFYAHDETNDAREGDRVRIAETRPQSKLKRWRLVEVVERAR